MVVPAVLQHMNERWLYMVLYLAVLVVVVVVVVYAGYSEAHSVLRTSLRIHPTTAAATAALLTFLYFLESPPAVAHTRANTRPHTMHIAHTHTRRHAHTGIHKHQSHNSGPQVRV